MSIPTPQITFTDERIEHARTLDTEMVPETGYDTLTVHTVDGEKIELNREAFELLQNAAPTSWK